MFRNERDKQEDQEKMNSTKIGKGMAAVLLLFSFLWCLAGCDLTGFSSLLGKRLIKKRCSACHTTKRIYKSRRSMEEWQQIIGRMIRHGAELSKEERTQILDYIKKELTSK